MLQGGNLGPYPPLKFLQCGNFNLEFKLHCQDETAAVPHGYLSVQTHINQEFLLFKFRLQSSSSSSFRPHLVLVVVLNNQAVAGIIIAGLGAGGGSGRNVGADALRELPSGP